jgi:hypothetical protein
LEHFWCMDEPQASTNSQDLSRLGLGGSHHLPPYNILYGLPWGLHPNVIFLRIPKSRVSKFPKLRLSSLWMPIFFCENLWLKRCLYQIYTPCQELSNDMWHAFCTHGTQGDSWLLMVRNQIDILIPSPSFGHNLCHKYSNG